MNRFSLALRAAVAGAFLVSAVPGPTARADVFDPETFTLDNGMEVVVVTNRSAPVVSHMVWYGVGAADEPWGDSGIAHFLEHLMFRGTEEVADGEFSAIVSRHGGNDNAFTSWDYTAYFQNIAVDRLPTVMELEADRMVNLVLDEEIVRTERAVILEERFQRTDSNPSARLAEQMYAALFQNHPYGVPIIGWAHEVSEMSLDEVRDFYERWYAPNNAVLVVSGDIDAETLRPLAERTYGQIPANPEVPAERIRPMEPQQATPRRVTLQDPDVRQPSWRRYYLGPTYANDPDDHAYALQVLSEILGGGTTGRLYRSLVVEQQLAVSAATGYSADNLDYAPFAAVVVPASGVEPEEVEAAFEAEVARIRSDGVTEDELESAKQRLVTAADYARDSLQGPARVFGEALVTGQTVADVEAWPDRIAAVTAEQVRAAARDILQEDASVTGILLPGGPPARQAAAKPAPQSPATEVIR
ncbi:MAG TPA: pitrilysin family protein [Alphaproteobacteria bacterium]|nr:pitrilysin family protein [Alphaproteobacteria bacterium]